MSNWLGIDIGTTNLKAYLLPAGRVFTVPTPATADGLQRAARALVDQVGTKLDGIGISGMAETGAALDRHLQPLTPLISWRDQPGHEQAEELSQVVGAAELYARTGLRLSPKLPIVTWRWLGDAVRRRTRIWAGAPDLVLAALTGTFVTHLTHAQRFGVLNLSTRTWDGDLLAFGGLNQLPPVVEPLSVAARTREGVPVVLAGHDHLVGAWAAGVREPGQVADSLGTSEAVITPCVEPVTAEALRLQGISSGWFVDGRRGCAIAGHGAVGGLVDQRLEALGRDHGWLAGVLEAVGQPSGRMVLPYPQGRQAPMPDSTSTYDPEAPAEDHAEDLRALVDGLCFHARWMAEEQTRLLGIDWRGTIAYGGPVRLAGWMRRKALVSLQRARGSGIGPYREFAVVEGGATAAAGAAMMAAEVVTGQPVEPLPSRRIEVCPQLGEDWDGAFWHRFHKVVTTPTGGV